MAGSVERQAGCSLGRIGGESKEDKVNALCGAEAKRCETAGAARCGDTTLVRRAELVRFRM